MNEQEFDERYQDIDIESETQLLAYFVDILFYNFTDNLQYSCHRKADIKGTINLLSGLTRDYPECKTFGKLKQNQPKLYETLRKNFLLCINKYHYFS
jgi:hypothetical protein